ncbi:MAG: SMC-Scp complex subunit ScpB [Candidatus Magasanikbacteria bacterium]
MKKEHKAKLETFLFQYGDPASLEKISNVLSLSKEKSQKLIERYKSELEESESRGVVLIEPEENKFQLITKPKLKGVTKQLAKDEFSERLTPATLEALTIIAYLGPISKADIDFIRGVNSSHTLRRLLMRGLIEKKKDGRSYLYKISTKFLKHMGLKSQKELPEYKKYKNLLEDYQLIEE